MKLLIDSQYFATITESKNLILNADIILFVSGHYQKHSFTNRLFLAGSQGLLSLSIPIVGGRAKKQQLKDVQIDYTTNWHTKHWRTIESSYRRAPWFEFYETDLKNFYESQYEYLWKWNYDLLIWILNRIGINRSVVPYFGEELSFNNIADFRKATLPRNYLHMWDMSALTPYPQVFQETQGFLPNLSILDLLFNLGPNTLKYLNQVH